MFPAWKMDSQKHHKSQNTPRMEIAREEVRNVETGAGCSSCGQHIREKEEGPREGEELVVITQENVL